MAGDLRWAGTFGVNVDFVARSHCSVALITMEDIQVVFWQETQYANISDLFVLKTHIESLMLKINLFNA